MALKLIEGFDGNTASGKYITRTWSLVTSRTGSGNAARMACNNTTCLRYDGIGDITSGVIGFLVQRPATGGSSNSTVHMWESDGTAQLALTMDDDFIIRVRRGNNGNRTTGTIIGASAAGVFQAGIWYYVEMKFVIHDTTGSVEVRVDGTTVINETNIDTRNGGTTGAIDSIRMGGNSGSTGQHYIDDLYVLDLTGGVNDDFLGDCIVETLLPDGDGNYSAWTPQGGGANYVEVDEASADGDTTYVSTGTANAMDTYTLDDLAITGGSVFGICVQSIARHEGGGGTMRNMIRSGTTDDPGATFAPAASYASQDDIWDENPDAAAAWTVATINALEAGVEHLT